MAVNGLFDKVLFAELSLDLMDQFRNEEYEGREEGRKEGRKEGMRKRMKECGSRKKKIKKWERKSKRRKEGQGREWECSWMDG